MKRENNIRKIERHLSLKRMKNQKKHSIQIFCIAVLACLLMQLGFQMTFQIQKIFEENKKDIYGEWERILVQIDAPSKAIVYENPFIAIKGEVKIYGVLEGEYWENKQSNIGTMDEAAWECGRLKLREGRLPQKSSEIAMEYSMLAALGYDKKLGEEITLKIVPSVEYSGEEEPAVKEFVYTLCGIIKDYQVNWETSTRNRLPTGLVTPDGAKKIGAALETHILIKARAEYESVYEDLKKSEEITCGTGENFSHGSLVTDNIPFAKFLYNTRFLVAGAAICILFITVSYSIDERNNFWKFLNALGMKRRQMYRMMIWEAGIYGTISVVIGTAGGIVLYIMILPVFGNILGKIMIRQISCKAVISGVICSMFIVGISYFFSCTRLNKILKGGRESKKQRKYRREKSYVVSSFTPFSVVMHQWRYAGTRKVVQILLLSSILVIAGFGLLEVKEKKDNLKMFKQATGNGYFLDTETITDSPGMRIGAVQSFTQIAGVESVEIYHTNGSYGTFTIDLSEYADNQYQQAVLKTEQKYREDASIDKVWLNILGVNEWENLKRFTKNLSEGKIDQSDFERGDFCILLLPPLEKRPEGYLGNNQKESFQESFLTEEDLEVGGMLNISHWENNGKKEEKQMQIDGILRSSKAADIRSPYPGGSGMHIIVGSGFWEKYHMPDMKEYCQKVRINVSDDAEIYDTEEHILRNIKTIGTVNFNNYHQEYVQKQRDMYSFIGMYSIFIVFYMILTFIVLYQMLAAEVHEGKKNIETFRALGMKINFILKMRRTEIILMVSFAVVGSAVILGCYYILEVVLK